jgi:phosphoribosylformimino-5-aminoimidazole carboxamide ribotide isomerase
VIIIPAIDVRGGRCVRLREGRAEAETVFAEDPVAMARHWVDLGAERLHVVDLDGALGASRQTALVRRIIEGAAPVPVQVGGGLRDERAVAEMLEAGARWVVIGTRAALDPAFLGAVCRSHSTRVIVAVDGRGARVAIKGWTEVVDETVTELGLRARAAGAEALLYTDIGRDGTESGPNIPDTEALARAVEAPVLASGGVASIGDLQRLAAIPGVAGVVVGRALYTGAIDLGHALAAMGARC